MLVPDFETKICAPDVFRARVEKLPRPLVFTNGCFDLLHRGHASYLAQARALGKSLVVGINSDESMRRQNKGANRPINPLADRMAVLAALQSVSLVVAFADDTPLQLIVACRPDVLVKGADWAADAIIGAKEVEAWGGSIVTIPLIHATSTSRIIARIRESLD